jgi:hypothetical protein
MLEKLNPPKWPAMTIELAILTVTTGLILKSMVSGFIILSFSLILCTFALQTTSVRFIWLYPIWTGGDRRSTERTDTFFLKFYLLFSSFFLALGVFSWFALKSLPVHQSKHLIWLVNLLKCFEVVLLEIMFYLIAILGFIVPLCFLFYGNKKIRKKLDLDQARWKKELPKE